MLALQTNRAATISNVQVFLHHLRPDPASGIIRLEESGPALTIQVNQLSMFPLYILIIRCLCSVLMVLHSHGPFIDHKGYFDYPLRLGRCMPKQKYNYSTSAWRQICQHQLLSIPRLPHVDAACKFLDHGTNESKKLLFLRLHIDTPGFEPSSWAFSGKSIGEWQVRDSWPWVWPAASASRPHTQSRQAAKPEAHQRRPLCRACGWDGPVLEP